MSSPPGGLTSTIADLYTGGDYEKAKRVIRLVRDFDAQEIGASSPDAVFSDAPKEPSPSQELIRAGDVEMLAKIRNYFAERPSAFEQHAFTILDRMLTAAKQSSPQPTDE